MAQNIFDATLDVDNDIKVNNFDWSHANNLTTKLGQITPIYCDLVPAHSSVRINPSFALQFMPMVFPIQTRMKARMSFFRYPLRALWKDYKDFVGNFREGLEEPYINFNTQDRIDKMVSTGSLGDYLGLPTTQVGNFGSWIVYPRDSRYVASTAYQLQTVPPPPNIGSTLTKTTVAAVNNNTTYGTLFAAASSSAFRNQKAQFEVYVDRVAAPPVIDMSFWIVITTPSNRVLSVSSSFKFDTSDIASVTMQMPNITESSFLIYVCYGGSKTTEYVTNGSSMMFGLTKVRARVLADGNVASLTVANSPYYNSTSANKDKQIKISAYAFRAYEGICNYFFRDNRNNPYYINGQVSYNDWIPSREGGVDNNLYELRFANWEKDFLTTAVQSPQQGQAPLVGITTYQTIEKLDDGSTKVVNKVALVDEDGSKFGLEFKADDQGLNDIAYVELDNGTAMSQARSLIDLANSGISISDLRNVNAYQKFLELNMRKGYNYRDIVKGRFNVRVRYSDLLEPEYFGGATRDINMNAITQTVDQGIGGKGDYASALGSQAGLASVRGSSGGTIECFCDEESIIIGILTVVPLPVYTQLLPKHFTYRGLLDHYQPEFNHIGFQPILYKEVTPIQAFNESPDMLNETFGYQRPWYEYVQRYDSAHGEFRTTLHRFLMNRVFDSKPTLSQSFLLVDPDQVNDVFSVTESTDKIYGQIWLDITAKLPIARVAIPRLD